MKKGISKGQIVEAVLELADKRQNMRSAGFRDIARRLGCAHTNLYNYFDSYDSLLWGAKEEIVRRLYGEVKERLIHSKGSNEALETFFSAILDTYLSHTGWFYLTWFEQQDSPRLQSHYDLTVSTVDMMVEALTAIFADTGSHVELNAMRMNLHNVNAYVHGELSIYLAGRGLIREEQPFKDYVVKQAARMMRLLVNDIGNTSAVMR